MQGFIDKFDPQADAPRVHSMHFLGNNEQNKRKLCSFSFSRAFVCFAMLAHATVHSRTSTTLFPASRFCLAGAKLVLRSSEKSMHL